MNDLVGTYEDEWKGVVNNPERQKQFRQFVNTVNLMYHVFHYECLHVQDDRQVQIEEMVERGQVRPTDWTKESNPLQIRATSIETPKSQWRWRNLAKVSDMTPTNDGTT